MICTQRIFQRKLEVYLKKNKDKENICVVHQHIGYKKDPSNKNRLIIDEKVADIVKLIFNMYENGTGSKKIVEYLNNKHYLSPSGYRKTEIVCDENKNNYNWNATTLCAMLENECYIGNTVQNKVTVVSYKVKKIRKVDETQYIRVENTHEAIIDKDMFEKVQTLHQKRAKVCEKQYLYLLKGLLYCKHCKWQLQVVLKVHHRSNREKIPYIVDTDYKKRNCYARNLNYYKFEKKIIDVVKKVCQIYADKELLEKTYKKVNNKSIDLIETIRKNIENIKNEIQNINNKLDLLYEDKLNGLLQSSDFSRISQKYVKSREESEIKLNEYTEQLQMLQGQQRVQNENDVNEMNELINEFLKLEKIDKSYLYRLINKIEIDKDKNVFISFNFAPLNTICNDVDEFIELEKVLQKEKDFKEKTAV